MPVELEVLEQYFTDSEEASRDARSMSERSRDYYDGTQLSAAEIKVLKNRKQPKVVFNKIQPKVDFLAGTEQQQRTDPKAFPRTPKHDEDADAVTDAIRFVLDHNDFDVKSSDVFESEMIEGTDGVSVEAETKGDEIWIAIKRWRWDRFFADPFSMEKDHSDARYTGVVAWKDLEEAKLRWKDKAEQIQANFLNHASDTFDDKPTHWFDRRRKRVMCIDMYFRHDGKWHKAIFAKGVWLEAPKLSPYIDEDKEPVNAHIAQSAKVKRDGQRYGIVENLLDIQDEINKRRSKALHILNARQTFAKEGRITDLNKFKNEANKSDGHLQFPSEGEFGKDFGIIPNEQFIGPQFQMYQEANQQMDAVGANAALAGKIDESLSGRAVQSLQQGGMIELTPLFGGHASWKKRVYRAVWDRIRQFWTEERWLRVTDDEENLKFVGLNVPVTLAEQNIANEMEIDVRQVKQEFADEVAEIHRRAPEFSQVVATQNDVAEIDVDIILEEVPDVVNLQSEQFDLLVKMYQANPEGIPWEDVVQMSTLRNKDRILGKELDPEEQEAAEEAKAQKDEALQLEKTLTEADIGAKQAKAAKDASEAIAQGLENQAVEQGLLEFDGAQTR